MTNVEDAEKEDAEFHRWFLKWAENLHWLRLWIEELQDVRHWRHGVGKE